MARIYPKIWFGSQLVDESQAKLDITTSAVLYGLSVYTVFPVLKGNQGLAAFRLSDHLRRLAESSRIIGIDTWSMDEPTFTAAVKELIHQNAVSEDVFVRASLHVSEKLPGTRSRGLATTFSMFAYEAVPILPQDGARLKSSVWRRIPDYAIPSRAKVNGAYVNSVLAKQDAIDSGYDDCIFLDGHGHVCELSAANIFMVRKGKLITPGLESDLLEGINRSTVLQIAKDMGIDCEERAVDLTELYVADEAFACGTSAFVAPVKEVDARIIGNGQVGKITAQIKKQHEQILSGGIEQYKQWLTPL